MKYLADIGSVKSHGDIISEQNWLPIKRLSESFQSNIHLFQSYRIIDGLGRVSAGDSVNTEASLCLGHGATQTSIAVMAFCSSHGLLHALATSDGHSSCRVAFIFISENFARKIVLEDLSIERLPSSGKLFKDCLGEEFSFFGHCFFLIVSIILKIGETRSVTIPRVSGASQQYSLCNSQLYHNSRSQLLKQLLG